MVRWEGFEPPFSNPITDNSLEDCLDYQRKLYFCSVLYLAEYVKRKIKLLHSDIATGGLLAILVQQHKQQQQQHQQQHEQQHHKQH